MKIINVEQRSREWWDYKAGKISGTRFSQCISDRDNSLIFKLLNETIDNFIEVDEYVNEDMQYGIDNESTALELYTAKSGIQVKKVGIIQNELIDIHIASPDGLSECGKIVQEVKSTQNGALHLQRYFRGFSNKEIYQCINYLAVEPTVEEVHLISFCGYRDDRPMFFKAINRDSAVTFNRKTCKVSEVIEYGLKEIVNIKELLNTMLLSWQFYGENVQPLKTEQ